MCMVLSENMIQFPAPTSGSLQLAVILTRGGSKTSKIERHLQSHNVHTNTLKSERKVTALALQNFKNNDRVITFTVEGKGDLGKVNFPVDRLRKSSTVIYEV